MDRKEYIKKYNKEHPEVQKRALENFKQKHDWTKYCNEARKRRIERLKAAGCTNPWNVCVTGAEPKYKKEDKAA